MSRITTASVRLLMIVSLVTARANAQQQPGSTDRAPIPRQVLDARTVFIGNGGGQSFGAESYYSRTKYDGGPNRVYDEFYTAVKDWGHYDIVGSTDAADVALVIRFSSPIVDAESSGAADNRSTNPVYDPQLNLSINDPHTGLPLWTITEHIEPGDHRADDNRHFDEAIGRVVNDLRRLILTPELALSQSDEPPPGARHIAEVHRRQMDAGIGLVLGSAIGAVLTAHTANYHCAPFPTYPPDLNAPLPRVDLACDERQSSQRLKNEIVGSIGGAIIGSLVGWVFPVSF
ncbi:MAG TPA: hypothetical protein VGJ18_24595 [Gemmatimonadaceae bacterium]